MTGGGNWTQLLTLGAVILGGVITMSTTWLANLQQNINQARERREDRLMPLYIDLHIAIRDIVMLVERYALADFPRADFTDREAEIKSAWEALKRIGYRIDFMSPPRIAFNTELLEDSLTRLVERLGFRLRFASIPPIPEARSQDYVRSELRAISERRMLLLEEMQDDLALTERPNRVGRSIYGAMRRSSARTKGTAPNSDPTNRDQDGFLIDDGRYR